jgi:adenosylhomocysteine nucleosidase
VAIGGGTYAGALKAAEVLVELGVEALISFGVAGGLDPELKPGALLAAAEIMVDGQVLRATLLPPNVRQVRMLGAKEVVATVAQKAMLWSETRAACVDLESGAVALVARRHRLPFGALRAICDPASRALPPAATDALVDGSIQLGRVLRSLLRQPGQLPALMKLARDARLARLALQSVQLAPPG